MLPFRVSLISAEMSGNTVYIYRLHLNSFLFVVGKIVDKIFNSRVWIHLHFPMLHSVYYTTL